MRQRQDEKRQLEECSKVKERKRKREKYAEKVRYLQGPPTGLNPPRCVGVFQYSSRTVISLPSQGSQMKRICPLGVQEWEKIEWKFV